jgi:hypothetical protein
MGIKLGLLRGGVCRGCDREIGVAVAYLISTAVWLLIFIASPTCSDAFHPAFPKPPIGPHDQSAPLFTHIKLERVARSFEEGQNYLDLTSSLTS